MCFIDRLIQQQGGVVRCPTCKNVVQDHRICPNCIANAKKPKSKKQK